MPGLEDERKINSFSSELDKILGEKILGRFLKMRRGPFGADNIFDKTYNKNKMEKIYRKWFNNNCKKYIS